VAGDDAAALPGGGRLANNHWQWLITLSRYGRTSPGHDGGGARMNFCSRQDFSRIRVSTLPPK
jgi:hypothetical protein